MNTRIATLLTLALAATALAQTPPPPGSRRLPGRSLPASRPTSQSYIAPTAKSDDLVESPATNVVKGAFGYTLGAIWDGKIPEEAEPDKNGEVSVLVEAKEPFEPFSSVTLSISTNDSRIACIAAETPRMILAESYAETCEKIGEIAAKVADGFGVKAFITCHTNQVFKGSNLTKHQSDNVLLGKLYRDYLENHPEDHDFIFYKNITISPFFWYTIHPIAGSRYNERPIGLETARPDYLQHIWQPCNLSADYFPYTGEAVIRFSVRDVEDRTEHTNLISVAEIKKQIEEEAEKRAAAVSTRAAAVSARRLPGRTQPQLSEEEKAKMEALKKAEQAFKDSLYRLSFAEAVEKSKENDPEALLRLALAFSEGKEVSQNIDKAQEYLEHARLQGYGAAQYVFGLSAGRGMFKKQDDFERHSYYIERDKRWRQALSKIGCPESAHLFRRTDMHLGGKNMGGEECWYRTQGVLELQRLEREKEVASLAIDSFEKAITNGIVIAQESLEFMRKELEGITKEIDAETLKVEERETANALKRKNEELLKGAMPDGDAVVAIAMPTPSSATDKPASTNNTHVVCGIRLGEANDNPNYGYNQKGYRETYEISKGGEKATYSCLKCGMWRSQSFEETLFGTLFDKALHVSITSHKAYAVYLSHNGSSFEAKENDYLSYPQFKLAEQIVKVLKSKYGEPSTDHSGNSKRGKRKWFFEKDGLYITVNVEYWSRDPTTEQAQKGLRTYYANTYIQYIHLPTLEAAIEEGREFLARPPETDEEGAKRAAERL